MRKWLTALLAAAMLLAAAPPVRAAGPDIAAPSAILMDAATGTVLYEKNASERLRPASVTKVMTLLLVMEALDTGRIGWDDTVIASEAACAKGGSQVYLEPGEEMSMDEMLKSVVVSSANDCATALAEHVAGSESAFVGMMIQRAQELGLLDTNFVTCTGLADAPEAAEHLTTAHDIAVISRELLKHDRIRDYTTIWMDTVRGGKFGLSNTNKLVRFYQGTTGLKTGYTSAAGHCLAASAKRDGIELIAVVLHCASSAFPPPRPCWTTALPTMPSSRPRCPSRCSRSRSRSGRRPPCSRSCSRPRRSSLRRVCRPPSPARSRWPSGWKRLSPRASSSAR